MEFIGDMNDSQGGYVLDGQNADVGGVITGVAAP
jgi:hypothetical protein